MQSRTVMEIPEKYLVVREIVQLGRTDADETNVKYLLYQLISSRDLFDSFCLEFISPCELHPSVI